MIEIENRHLKSSTCEDVFTLLEKHGYQGWFYNRSGDLISVGIFDAAVHQKVEPGRFWAKKPISTTSFFGRKDENFVKIMLAMYSLKWEEVDPNSETYRMTKYISLGPFDH